MILDLEIIPLLSGLLTSLLPGLEEQDEQLQTKIMELLREINEIVGDKFFISNIWFIMLKNSKNRLSAFKVLNQKFGSKNVIQWKPKLKPDNALLQQVYDDIRKTNGQFEAYFSNSWMILNALSKCLQDEDISTQKVCLDFINQNIDVNQMKIFDKEKRVFFFTSLVSLIETSDISLIKRIFRCCFGVKKLNNFRIQSVPSNLLEDFCQSFSKILQKDPTNLKEATRPFRVLYSIQRYSKELLIALLKRTSYHLILFIFQWGYKQTQFNTEVIQNTKEFLSEF